MPELPEVETIVRGLQTLQGRRIARVLVSLPAIIQSPGGVDVKRRVAGARVEQVRRRGKFTVLTLDTGDSLVVSLRMTGRLTLERRAALRGRHEHAGLLFEGGECLVFADVRKFGRVRLVAAGEPWDADLGIEPLGGDFTPDRFICMLAGRRTPIKAWLLDQRRLAGVGNIYACEALWAAGIRPGKPAKALSKPAIRRLHRALTDVLHRAVALRGSSIDDYVDSSGRKGEFQSVLSVYGKAGKTCPRCHGPIVRTVIAQRGTWWCRACQK